MPVFAVKTSSTGLMRRSERPEYIVSVSAAETEDAKIPAAKSRKRLAKIVWRKAGRAHMNDMSGSFYEIEIDKPSQNYTENTVVSSMTAARTEAVEFKPVGFNGESVSGGHFFLKPLNFLILKFNDFLATGTDEVVVVSLVGDVVVFRLRAEMSGLSEAGIAEQIERPINGRES